MYTRRGKGGRGLIEVEECVRAEEEILACYAKGIEEWLMKIAAKDVEEMEDGKTYRKRVAGERGKIAYQKRNCMERYWVK